MFDYGDSKLLENLDQSTRDKLRYLYKETEGEAQALCRKVWNILYKGRVETIDLTKPFAQVTITRGKDKFVDRESNTATVVVQLTQEMLDELIVLIED